MAMRGGVVSFSLPFVVVAAPATTESWVSKLDVVLEVFVELGAVRGFRDERRSPCSR
jgi:hypothetical protein